MKRFVLALLLALAVAPASAEGCATLDPKLTFCAGVDWSPRKSKNPDVAASFRRGLTFRLAFLVGSVGTKSGETTESVFAFQRETYAEFSGRPLSELPILETEPSAFDGHIGEKMVFRVKIKDANYVIALSAFVFAEENLQVITLEQANTFNKRHRKWHDEALAETRFNPEGQE